MAHTPRPPNVSVWLDDTVAESHQLTFDGSKESGHLAIAVVSRSTTTSLEHVFSSWMMGQRRKDREWPTPATARHVWIQSPEHHQPPDPGLVITWARVGSTWWAWVVIIVDRPGKSAAMIQRWMHERDVITAPTRPQSPDGGRWHQGWMDG